MGLSKFPQLFLLFFSIFLNNGIIGYYIYISSGLITNNQKLWLIHKPVCISGILKGGGGGGAVGGGGGGIIHKLFCIRGILHYVLLNKYHLSYYMI